MREGHERAFEALVNRYRKPLLNYCRRMLPEARVEDVLQQALLKTWIALRGGAEVRDIKSWLYRVVHNTAVNAVRDAARDRERLADPTLRIGVSQVDLERGLVVREALAEVAALPELQREVIVRTAVGGHSHEQVASDLGITDGAVRGLLYRARATLRTAVTALTPPPLLSWLAGRADQGGPAPERLGELAGGGGAAGLGGLLVKGGVVAVTAGTLITGAAVVQVHHRAHHKTPAKVAMNSAGVTSGAPAKSPTVTSANLASTRPAHGQAPHAGAGGQLHLHGANHTGAPTAIVLSNGRRLGHSAPSTGRSLTGQTVPGTAPSSGSTQPVDSPQGGDPGQTTGNAGQGGDAGSAPSAGQSEPVGGAAGNGSAPEGAPGGTAEAPAGEAAGGSSPSGGGSESTSQNGGSAEDSGQSGGVVGTVVHEVGNLLEHLLH